MVLLFNKKFGVLSNLNQTIIMLLLFSLLFLFFVINTL